MSDSVLVTLPAPDALKKINPFTIRSSDVMLKSMKAALFVIVLATAFQSALAGDILFTNRTATFTNLQGLAYNHVQLVRGDQDGLIWRDGASGGRICYTNLHPDLLESFGISSNRIEIARGRAVRKAIADARYRAEVFARAQAQSQAKPDVTNTNAAPAAPAAPWLSRATAGTSPSAAYGADPMYPPFLDGPVLPYGFGTAQAPSALSAPVAPNAASVSSAGSVTMAGFAPAGVSAASSVPFLNAAPALSARSARPGSTATAPPIGRR